ncbi:Uncharacterized protein BP5553_06329 [Venustampulla echinocandica]|uniref:Zn(2)-C6 fungal-type domain-containing protein n=1 Tax=Venustampulla echinocandica TaxID=2656787 RepID=A0A370TJM4_9HELO|nr:Uncharacterized protein BP5553_06329 [Venustampulla echinocandica]RDL35717.1 Uncharacterized protein BP5553_06329 [Venustampulla echinocandica]
MTSRNSSSGLPRRRNGKQQACEPCRIAKIACDHALPVCDRCKRRKVSGKCVYLEAPMTRPSAQARDSSSTTAASRHRVSTALSSNTAAPLPSNSALASPSSTSPRSARGSLQSPAQPGNTTETSSSGRPPAKSGSSGSFFGPTSFSAVFMENRENFATGDNEMHVSNENANTPLPSESLQSQTFLLLSGSCSDGGNARVALGAKVLRALPDKNTCNFLLERYYEKCHESAFLKHSAVSCAASVWTTFGSSLKEPRKREGLEHVSGILFKNSTTALQEPSGPDDYTKWLESFSGENLRWESLGIVFACIAGAVLSMSERDAFFTAQKGGRRDRISFAMDIKDCVQACVTLSNYNDLINTLMIALLAKNVTLQTIISGDTSLVVWRQLGDLVSASTALGLHRQTDAKQPISFLTELRKRLFVKVFCFDKGAATLTGRPPALSYRYTRFQEPLDLSDDVITRGGEELAEAISKLDSNGWNTGGHIYRATVARTDLRLGIVLGEILELVLGHAQDCTEEQIRCLLERLDKNYSDFPSFLQFSLSDPRIRTYSDSHFWKTMTTRLYLLDDRLVLERLAHKRGFADGQSMVDCAREMLEITVMIWVQRDRFASEQHNFDWMLMSWGVPSAGVLCVELLNQLKHPGTPGLRIPRSEVVQNLSLVIGFLEWVRPPAGNYQICVRMKLIIKRILDRVLDPSPPSSQSTAIPAASQRFTSDSTAFTEAAAGQNFELPVSGVMGPLDTTVPQPPPAAFDSGNDEYGLDNLDWLNSVDWSRGPLIDLGDWDYSTMDGNNPF